MFWQFVAAAHISRANCAEITRDRLGQPAHETFSITGVNIVFTSLNFAPCVQGILRQTWTLFQNTRFQPLERQQPH